MINSFENKYDKILIVVVEVGTSRSLFSLANIVI